MEYKLSELPDIDVLKPDDTVIVDYVGKEETILLVKCLMLIQQHMAIWHGCEVVRLTNDKPGEPKTHYDTLYFRPQQPRHNLFGVSPLSQFKDWESIIRK